MKLIVLALCAAFFVAPSIALAACPPGYYNCGGNLCCPN